MSVTLISSTNKTNYHDITEILLKVVLNTINLMLTPVIMYSCYLNFFTVRRKTAYIIQTVLNFCKYHKYCTLIKQYWLLILVNLKGNFAIFYMLVKYVPGDIKYIFTKFYWHISTNNEANRKYVILISNFSTSLWRFKLKMHCGIEI